jgi:hypothetical protein
MMIEAKHEVESQCQDNPNISVCRCLKARQTRAVFSGVVKRIKSNKKNLRGYM